MKLSKYKILNHGIWIVFAALSFVVLVDTPAHAAPKKKSVASVLKAKGLTKVPSVAGLVKKNKKRKNTSRSNLPRITEVSGLAPTISEIPGQEADLFWPDGALSRMANGNPTDHDCNSFWSGQSDGDNSGMLGCMMAENVGRAMETTLQSATSSCYMSKFPNADSGVTLLSGEFPGGNPSKLFAPPVSGDRLVKVTVADPDFGNQNIFLKIFGQDTNGAAGNAYAHLLWFCQGDSPNADSTEQLEIKTNGRYQSNNIGSGGGDHGGIFQARVSAFIISQNGKLAFDTSKARETEATFMMTGEQSFVDKHELVITANNLMKTKALSLSEAEQRKGYSVSRFSGSSVADLRFLAGAYKDDNFSSVNEFRGDAYFTATDNEQLSSLLEEVDIETDSFYQQSPSIDFDAEQYPCNAAADVELALDMSDPALQAIAVECEGVRLDGMNFCWGNDQIQQAQQNFFSSCQHGPG